MTKFFSYIFTIILIFFIGMVSVLSGNVVGQNNYIMAFILLASYFVFDILSKRMALWSKQNQNKFFYKSCFSSFVIWLSICLILSVIDIGTDIQIGMGAYLIMPISSGCMAISIIYPIIHVFIEYISNIGNSGTGERL